MCNENMLHKICILHCNSFLACQHIPDADDADVTNAVVSSSVVFLLDASTSIGSSDFENMKISVASSAVNLAATGARVGVVVFSTRVTVDVPLQKWEDLEQLRSSIEEIRYASGFTKTHLGIKKAASILGSEGTRIIILLTDGDASNKPAAYNAADAAKRQGIRIYAGGIGDSVSEDELNSWASNPPEDYRVSIADFTETALDDELQPLVDSTCLSKNQTILVQIIRVYMYNYATSYMHAYTLYM